MAVYSILKFEDFFQPQKDEEYTIITFFDNMIRRDFLYILRLMADGKGCMLCDSVGYDLPDEDDEENELKDCIEVWEDCGGDINSCCLSYTQFIELLEIAGRIWLNRLRDRSLQSAFIGSQSVGIITITNFRAYIIPEISTIVKVGFYFF